MEVINVHEAKTHLSKLLQRVEAGEEIEIDFDAGTLTCSKGTLEFPPLPPEIVGIMEAGGLVPYTRKKVGLD